jgi:hypothetical protein
MMEEKQKVIRVGFGAVIVIVLAIAAYYFFFSERSRTSGAGGEPASAEKLAAEGPGLKEGAAVPPINAELDKSDEAVRGLAAELSSHPVFGEWLKNKDIIRRFVAAVDNIANGQSPRPQLDFFSLRAPFKTVVRSGKTVIDPASYDRYNVVADVFESLSAAGCGRLYESARPLLAQAYRELGYPRDDFHQTLLRAIVAVLRAPAVDEPIEVEKGVVSYIMKDPKLEDLDEVEKHLLRMGPENVQLVQAKLREIALALGFTEAQLPQPRIFRRSLS